MELPQAPQQAEHFLYAMWKEAFRLATPVIQSLGIDEYILQLLYSPVSRILFGYISAAALVLQNLASKAAELLTSENVAGVAVVALIIVAFCAVLICAVSCVRLMSRTIIEIAKFFALWMACMLLYQMVQNAMLPQQQPLSNRDGDVFDDPFVAHSKDLIDPDGWKKHFM